MMPIFAKGLPWYESLFDAARPGDLRGEASTHYTKLPQPPPHAGPAVARAAGCAG